MTEIILLLLQKSYNLIYNTIKLLLLFNIPLYRPHMPKNPHNMHAYIIYHQLFQNVSLVKHFQHMRVIAIRRTKTIMKFYMRDMRGKYM